MGNSFGNIFRLTTFGESHGKMIGGVIDGCPPSVELDFNFINEQLQKRRPGQSSITSQRNELDDIDFVSGIFEGKTTGSPIAFIIKNRDSIEEDYSHKKDKFRPSHADFTYYKKYGNIDYRGGGRSSARETANWVVAGSIALQILKNNGIEIKAYVSSVGSISLTKSYKDLDLSMIEKTIVRCPDLMIAKKMIKEIEKVRKEGDSIGGCIKCIASGVPPGLGDPVFNKLHSSLAKSMLSINAVHGFKYGFECIDISNSNGSIVNDIILDSSGKTRFNYSGGIQGGISNGNDIYCEVFFKPVSTIMKTQETIDKKGRKTLLEGKGRHDSCVVPRATPIVESMMALTLLDAYLINKINVI